MDIIIWIAIGYFVWRAISAKSQNSEDGENENQPRQLTETQKRWREKNPIKKPDSSIQDPDADVERPLTQTQREWRERRHAEFMRKHHQEVADHEQRVGMMTAYIQQNMRRFNIWEWLYWEIDPRFSTSYLFHVGPMVIFGMIFPMIMGWGVFWPIAMAFLAYFDIKAYQKYREMEVTVFNPEWHEKFGQE